MIKVQRVWIKLLCFITVSLILIVISQWGLKSSRLDLTEQGLFSLSEGTVNIIHNLNEKVQLSFFFSDTVTADLVQFRAYAQRVKALLKEYELIAKGRIELTIVDPLPFSEEEDQAQNLGLQGVPVKSGGDEAYFGLSAQTPSGKKAIVAFFPPSREAFLEYEISQLLYRMQKAQLPRLGILTSLDVSGGFDPRTGQPTPAWMAFAQLEQNFTIEYYDAKTLVESPDVELLMIIQPDVLSDSALYAIDQYIVTGGHAVIFQDPYFEMQPFNPGVKETKWPLETLYRHWGVDIPKDQVVVDKELAMVVSLSADRPPLRHGGLLALSEEFMKTDERITAELEKLTFAATGSIRQVDDKDIGVNSGLEDEGTQEFLTQSELPKLDLLKPSLTLTPLVQTSEQVMVKPSQAFKGLKDPSTLYENFVALGESLTLVAHLSGPITSAFAQRPELPLNTLTQQSSDTEKTVPGKEIAVKDVSEHVSQGEAAQILMVADVDMLTDRMWVEVQEIFGQRVAAPWADNGTFVANTLEYLSSNTDLMSVRSRGQYTRPFTVVEKLQKAAEEQFLDKELKLRQRLEETEMQLAQLEPSEDSEELTLTLEQQQAITTYQNEKLQIRKELRAVRRALDEDIERLHGQLKLINIAAMPFCLTLLALLGVRIRHRRRHS